MNNFTLQYPNYYILFCILLGALYAFGLYFRDKKFNDQKNWLPYLLGVFRFLAVTALSFLLLVPMLKSIFEEIKNPIIIIVKDQSGSISKEEMIQVNLDLDNLNNKLSDKFQIDEYNFSNELYQEVPDSFNNKSTNLEKVFINIDELYINQNVGAIILATDGIFNEGKNPLYLNNNVSAPLYTIALGDTIRRKDIVLKQVLNNKIVFLGDKFSVQIDINAQNCSGENTNLRISQIMDNGNSANSQSIPLRIDNNDFFTTKEIILEANQSGVNRFVVEIVPVRGEASNLNNRKDIFIEVLDARQKILLLANAPHPDISAFKHIIESNKNYEVTTSFIDNNDPLNGNFDLIVLHNLPSNKNNLSEILRRPNLKNASRFFILGSQTNQKEFNQLQSVINLEGNSVSLNEIQAIIDDGFNLFNLSDEIKQELPIYPPVLSPFGKYQLSPNATNLLNQKIGKVETDYPLLSFNDQEGVKTGVFAAEGIWKWRLFNYLQDENYDLISTLLNKSLQYLTLKEDKRKFRVSTTQNIFKENENIILTAELYNDSYEKINESEVNVVITDSKNKDYNFVFSKRNDYYYLDAGNFPSGLYKFKANVDQNGKKLEFEGKFSVENIQLEAYDLTARHGLLKTMSEKFGGQLIDIKNIDSIQQLIEENNQIKPVIYASSRTNKWMDNKWIFFLIFSLLGAEWFLRRYFGSY